MSTTPSSVRVWTPPNPPVAPPPSSVSLMIRNDGHSVTVYAVEEDGHHVPGGMLVRIGPDGLYRCGYINPDVGLPRDQNDRLALVEE